MKPKSSPNKQIYNTLLIFIIFRRMRDNQFYQRLNQIRSKYGYFGEKETGKQNHLSFNKPNPPTIQSYRETLKRNEPSPKRFVPQYEMTQQYHKAQIQKPLAMGPSPNRTYEKERTHNNTTTMNQNKMRYKEHLTQRSYNENESFTNVKTNFKNTLNETFSPSPIKKLGGDSSYQSSPVRRDKFVERAEDYQALKPYNRASYDVPFIEKSQKVAQKGKVLKIQRDYNRAEKRISSNLHNRSFREQISFENHSPYLAKTLNTQADFTDNHGYGNQENFSKDSAFMQKYNFSVKNIDKIQDKINSILHRK